MFAEVVLYLFIPLAIGVFFVARPLPAALFVILAGVMFLPVGVSFHIPFVPGIDKENLPYLCVLIGCLLRCPGRVTKLPKEKWFLVISLVLIAGGVGTALTNSDSIPIGRGRGLFLPGMTFKDGMATALSQLLNNCVTFYIGFALCRGEEDIEKLLAGLAIAGLVYSPFAMYEARMSPQLHGMFYGFNNADFFQTRRWGGFRPMVCMPHGLALARFFVATNLALFVLARIRRRLMGIPVGPLAWFQAVVLVLCKSTGAIFLAFVGVLVIKFVSPKRQLTIAAAIGLVTVAYPILRGAELFPVTSLLDAAGEVQEERAGSLHFRFVNEDILLERARERIVFGWGTYGRNRTYNDKGENAVITDGYWIMVLGTSGIIGFLGAFGTLALPLFWARRRLQSHGDSRDKRILAGLAVILALVSVDLIPNGLWSYYPYLLAGALTLRARELRPTSEIGET